MVAVKNGYKITEMGMIPDDWDVKIFKEIFKVNQGLQIAIEKRYNYPSSESKIYITIQYLNDGKSVEYINDYSKSVCCEESDVLMTRTGNTGMVITNVNGVFHNNFFKIKFDKDYIVFYLKQNSTQKKILEKAGTSTIPDLNHNDFYSLAIPLPPTLQEQKAIATALSDVDDLITSLDKLIEKKKMIKQGAMQELLTPKNNSKIVKLGRFAEMSSGGTPSSKIDEYYNGDIIWISISDITKSGKYINNSSKKITQKGLENSSARIFPVSTVFLAMYASIGKCSIITKEASTSQAILGITPKEKLLNEYLYYFLLHYKDAIARQGQQGTQSNLNKGMVQDLDIILPSIQDQNDIVEILSSMDSEIDKLENKQDKYKLIKEGMMQELLTGKTRLV